jgi:glycosyltransferase involved in cell wall biosynthesis
MRAFEDVYNPAMAVEVARLLDKKFPDFQMVMAGGDKGLLTAIKRMVSDYGLTTKVLFPGYINHQQKLQYAREYDIYICTNKIDNAPVSVIEFMALGLPIVSVNTGGIPYIIKDGENGLLVNDEDVDAMVEKIEMLIQQPALTTQIAANALNYSRRYDEAPVLGKWIKLFAQMQETEIKQ